MYERFPNNSLNAEVLTQGKLQRRESSEINLG